MFKKILILAILLGMTGTALMAQENPKNLSVETEKMYLDMFLAQNEDSVEPGPPGQFGQPRHKFRDMMRDNPDFESQRKHMEQLRTLKMLEMLDLQDEQEIAFLTSYKKFRQELHELRVNKIDILERMSDLVKKDDARDKDYFALIDEYMANEEATKEANENFLNEMKSTLNADQLVKFIIFEERFEAELLERVRGMRRGGGGGRP